jgi:signal transduction histidine kinase
MLACFAPFGFRKFSFWLAPLLQSSDGQQLAMLALAGGVLIGLAVGVLLTWLSNWVAQANAKKQARLELEKARQTERTRLRSVFDMISGLSSTLIYSKVLDMTMELTINALTPPGEGAEKIVGAVLLFTASGSETQLQIASYRRLTLADARVLLPGTQGAIGDALNKAEPALCKDIAADPELRRLVGLRTCQVVYCVPLRRAPEIYGVLLFGHADPNFFTSTQRDIAEIAAHQATIAIQNANLYNDLEQEKERMLQIQEEARKKLARDLHDGPTQSVAALAMRANFTRRLMEKDPKSAANELMKIEELARRTTKEIRHMLFTLRPLVLESQGLEAALQAMADKMQETYEQDVQIEADNSIVNEIEMGKQTVMFYIAEEAVNNARKHAQAAHIWVRLRRAQPDVALLEIQDNGVGFNLGAVDANYDRRGSLGMVNMRERTELINGALRIDSSEGQGTAIRVYIPLTEEAEERLRKGI